KFPPREKKKKGNLGGKRAGLLEWTSKVGKVQVSWGKGTNSNRIGEDKLPKVSPWSLLNQQTAICR
ncbi:hypothetical protein ACISSW_26190, partial [Escherichia coli]